MKTYAIFVLLSLVLRCSTRSPVTLRLVGKHAYEGRVEAFVDGEWGPISAKSWNKESAQVVCRQLGFTGEIIRYTKGLVYGTPKSNRPVWLRKINCNGNESNIDECNHSGWVINTPKLDFYDLAGVICRTNRGLTILPPISPTIYKGEIQDGSLDIRLEGEPVDGIISEGTLMVSMNGKWGHVCIDDWNERHTRVACGHLGFSKAQGMVSIKPNETTPILLKDIQCSGNEASIFSCHNIAFNDITHCSGVVWLMCEITQRTNRFKNNAKLKLRGGARPSEGRVEVYYDTRKLKAWATLCDDIWDLETANVVCRSLGYGTAKAAYRAAKHGQGAHAVIVDGISCKGNEEHISECSWTYLEQTKCSHFEDSCVTCNEPKYHKQEVRLVGGKTAMEGRVEVNINGKWGTICADKWNIKAAMTVCRELHSNFAKDAINGTQYGIGDGRMVMNGPICLGDETSLTKCLRDDDFNCSSPQNIAGVRCVDALPDLAVSNWEMSRTLSIAYIDCDRLKCAFEENCLADSAARYMSYGRLFRRRLMRFSTKIFNLGFADYRPWADKEDWIWHSCHKHYHSQEEFAVYDLLTRSNKKVAQGHKASFCLEDTECLTGVDRKYNCTAGTQGISMNCFDNYAFDIDCQWMDVTEVRYYNNYIVQVNINPRLMVAETDFDNNVIRCDIRDLGSSVHTRRCEYDYCASGLRSHGGNSNKACCVFPFVFKKKVYETCTKSGFENFWCATTPDYDKDKQWGLC